MTRPGAGQWAGWRRPGAASVRELGRARAEVRARLRARRERLEAVELELERVREEYFVGDDWRARFEVRS